MAFRQLVAADNCGTPNPLAGMAGAGQAGQLVGDARSFGPAGKQMGGVHSPGIPMEVLQAHHPRESEMAARYAGPQAHHPHHHPDQATQMRMVAEFEAMRLADQQMAAQAQAADWEKNFHQQQAQPQQHRAIPGLHQPPPQMMHRQMSMTGPYMTGPQMMVGHHPMMMGGMGGMYQQPMMLPQQHHVHQHLPHQQQQPQLATSQKAAESVSAVAAQQEPQSVLQEPAAAMGNGGIDLEAMRELREKGDEKFRNSKFLRFVDDINSGALRFEGNQVVPGSAAAVSADAVSLQASDDQKLDQVDDDGYPLYMDGGEDDRFGKELQARMIEQARGGEYGEFLQKMLMQPEADPGDLFLDMIREKQQKAAGYEFLVSEELNPELQRARGEEQPADAAEEEKQELRANSAFERGVQLFEAGEVSQAILAFEATVRLMPEHSEAWRYLGQAHAEHDSNNNAIVALQRCIELDPYNLPALLMLGVSYQNDLKENRALQHLRTWLLNNPDYDGIGLEKLNQEISQYEEHYHQSAAGSAAVEAPELGWGRLSEDQAFAATAGDSSLDHYMHNQVTRMFRHALQHRRQDDADLHTVVGVMLHLSDDFELAVDEFKAALRIRPNDASLWSKLGATLANGERYDQALPAYDRALALRPNSVRVLVNQGVSLSNMGMHKPAALAYIRSLEVNPDADRSWSYLRIALSHLGDSDLMQRVEGKDLAGLRAALA